MKHYKFVKTTTKFFIGFCFLSLFAVIIFSNFHLKADAAATVDLGGDYPNLGASDIPNVGSLLDRGLEFLEYFLGTLGFIGFLISGIMFGMTADNPEKANKAKKAMIYTAVGLVIAVLALVLTRAGFFVMGNNPS